MKNFVILCCVALFSVGSFGQRKVRGNGNEIVREHRIKNFASVVVGKDIDLTILNNEQTNRVSVVADSNIQRFIHLKVENDTLFVFWKPDFELVDKKEGNFEVKVSTKVLNALVVRDNASVEGIGNFKFEDFSLNASGTGDVKLNVSCNKLHLNNSGTGDVVLNGNGESVFAKVSGTGVTNLDDFSAFFMELDYSGTGDVLTKVVNGIDGTHSGTGDVYCKNTKIINLEHSGTGKIIEK